MPCRGKGDSKYYYWKCHTCGKYIKVRKGQSRRDSVRSHYLKHHPSKWRSRKK